MSKRFKMFISVFLMVLFIPCIVNARVLEVEETDVNLKGEYNESKLIFGSTVNNMATIDGVNMMFGNQVNSEGNILIGAYAGNVMTISDKVEKDLFIAGNMITVSDKAEINRDLFIAGNIVSINTDVARNLNIAASTVDLSGVTINGNAHIYADSIAFDDNTKINGTLTIDETTTVENLKESMYGKIVKEESEEVVEETLQQKITDAIMSIVTDYVTVLIILLTFGKIRKSLDKTKFEGKEITKTALIGLAALIVVPVIDIVVMFTGIFTPIALIVLALYIFGIYVSSLLASYVIAHFAWTRIQKSNIFIELLIGTVALKLISYIPFVSGLVGAVILFYGLGIICNLVLSTIKSK